MIRKECLYCRTEFEAKSPKAKFCSELHRNYYFRQHNPGYRSKKTLAGVDDQGEAQTPVTRQQQQLFPSLPVEKFHKMQSLDPASQMVFDLLREQNAELRNELKTKTKEFAEEIKALTAKVETLTREKMDLEKSRDDAQRAVEAKPTGLAGLVSNQPELLKDALPVLAGIVDKIMKPSEPVPPFVQWLRAQPEKFQQDFMAMVGAVMQNTDRLEMINRSLMTASSSQQQEMAGSSRYS